jgi:putative oxidoreductase
MKKLNVSGLVALLLRLAISIGYIWEVADRLGLLGKYGSPHVGWGDWSHFMDYAREVMSVLPYSLVPVFAVIATILEGSFGLLLFVGLFTKVAAIGSGLLSLSFAVFMSMSFGIESPIGYSVFTLSAASFLLAVQPDHFWSLDRSLLFR